MRNAPTPKIYSQLGPNEEIFLYEGSLKLVDGDQIALGTGNIRLTWYPAPKISVKFIYNYDEDFDFDSKSIFIELKEDEFASKIPIALNSGFQGMSQKEVSGYLLKPFVHGQTSQTDELNSVVFHLTNFPFLYREYLYSIDDSGNQIELEKWLDFIGQLVFDNNGWHIVLGCLNNCSDINQLLIKQGGYGLTHICKIEKLDKSVFSLNEVYEKIEAFCYYLSFIKGAWVPPILVSGFDEDGCLKFEEWRTPIIRGDACEDEYHFDIHDTWLDGIVPHFTEFSNKWKDSDWKEVIKITFQWYIESFKGVTSYQTSIVLLQAALEKISWMYLSKNDCLTSDNFKKIAVADQIRLLIKFLNIQIIDFPENSELSNISNEFNWANTIQAIVEIRNSVVHPPLKNTKNRQKMTEEAIMIDAVKISRQYLRIILFKLFDK